MKIIKKLCKDLSSNLTANVDYRLEKPKYGSETLEGRTFRIYKNEEPTSLFINEDFLPLDQEEGYDELLEMTSHSLQ